MQISIEQHNAVTHGLVMEMAIRDELLLEARADLALAQEDYKEVMADRNLLSKHLTDQGLEYERMLERIRQVAIGEHLETTDSVEPEWSRALLAVELLRAQVEESHARGLSIVAGHCGQCGAAVRRKNRRK